MEQVLENSQSACFTVSVDGSSSSSLQESFLKYKKRKQDSAAEAAESYRERFVSRISIRDYHLDSKQLKQTQRMRNKQLIHKEDPSEMQQLRKKFLSQAWTYMGVPYGKKYWTVDEPEFYSPLFLDCCGLIRQVMHDLESDFGFRIGPWNQAYMYDTLPVTLDSPTSMQPGDLVFIAATYYNEKAKRQKHDMVHVEIWLGDGEKTLGARWQRGKVEVHDSYIFEAKSYHSPRYIFKSIDTWLSGICKSHCDEHKWNLSKYNPSNKSIFYADDSDPESSDDSDYDPSSVQPIWRQSCTVEAGEHSPNDKADPRLCRGGRVTRPTCIGHKQASNSVALSNMASYQIAGANGSHIVDTYLSSLGWKKIPDKHNYSWKLKWVEVNSQVNYGAFRDGEQLVNRIPNCSLLTNKLGLFNSLSEYCRVANALKGDRVRLKMGDFFPESYRIDNPKDRETFLEVYKDGEIWICKPVGLNQGKGIFLIRSREQIDKMLEDREQRKQNRRTRPLMALIVQRYIERPLLLERKKFDIRSYMLIASTTPFVVLYRRGYVRLTCEEYDLDSLDLTAHLTNQFVQKKHEDYKDVKEDTVWSIDKMNQYVNENLQEEKGVDNDWILTVFEKQIKTIMKYCFNSVKHKLTSRLGLFDLYGLDFMIDENMKVWLIEINVNPAMHTNCDVLKETIPPLLRETVDLALECFDKSKKSQPILPLQSLKTFQMLFNGCTRAPSNQTPEGATTSSPNSNSSQLQSKLNQSPTKINQSPTRTNQSPTRTQNRRSMSPSKDQSWGYITRSPIKSSKPEIEAPNKQLMNGSANNLTKTNSTNYIKNNIANLGNLTNHAIRNRNPSLPSSYSHRSGRLSRLDTKNIDQPRTDSGGERSDTSVIGPFSAQEQTIMTSGDSQKREDPGIKEETEGQGQREEQVEQAPVSCKNAVPMTTQQIAARARGTTSTATAQGFSAQTITEQTTPEQILQELKDLRPKPQLLPPLYTLRSDVVTSRNAHSQHQQQSSGVDQTMLLQGYPAISSNGNDQLNSAVRLSMVHVVPTAPHNSGKNRNYIATTSRHYSRDRAS